MRRLILNTIALAAAVWLAACGANPVPQAPEPTDSIVFGHIDMDDAPVELQGLSIRQYKPPTDKPYWAAGVEKGTFFNWYLDPGSYAVSHFEGFSFGGTRYRFNVPRQLSSMRIVIKKPGVYFLGSYKYKNISTGIFEPDKFDLQQVDSPTERELLTKLIAVAKGTVVESKLRARLKELR